MSWIDTHCHLGSVEDRQAVMSRARQAGVAAMVTVGTDLQTSKEALEHVSEPDVFAVVGVHPYDAKDVDAAVIDELERMATSDQVVAIGEIGMDLFRQVSPIEDQVSAFEMQLALARRVSKAVVLHVRDAYEQVFEVLSRTGPPERLIFHCFSGGPPEAERAVALGGYVSFAGNVTYKSAGLLRDAAAVTPLDRILVETDSPYLTPVPHRGEPNEPSMVPFVGAAVAKVKGVDPEDLAEITSSNARNVFGLPE